MVATAWSDKTIRWAVIGFALLAVAGWLLPAWILNNVMFGLARGLAVLGLLVLWRTGLVSFGHALYFGLGAYAVALLELEVTTVAMLPVDARCLSRWETREWRTWTSSTPDGRA